MKPCDFDDEKNCPNEWCVGKKCPLVLIISDSLYQPSKNKGFARIHAERNENNEVE